MEEYLHHSDYNIKNSAEKFEHACNDKKLSNKILEYIKDNK